MQFLSESQHKIILKSTHKGKETKITKSILKNEEEMGGITIFNSQTYYKQQ